MRTNFPKMFLRNKKWDKIREKIREIRDKKELYATKIISLYNKMDDKTSRKTFRIIVNPIENGVRDCEQSL